jgi:ubiquinone/menaquinone biosynthesis C-methylase UbiE
MRKVIINFKHPRRMVGDRSTANEKTTHNEIVLDSGCGTGRVSKITADTVKKGKVYAVDTDDNMIANAKKQQGLFKHCIHQTIFTGS